MSKFPIQKLVDEVLGPLVEGDHGELYIESSDAQGLRVHLRGKYSGCPGNTLAIRRVIEPILKAHYPSVGLIVTSGDLIPEGTTRWQPPKLKPKNNAVQPA